MNTTDTILPTHLKALLDLTGERQRPSRFRDYIPFYLSLSLSYGLVSFIDGGHAATLLIATMCSASLFSIQERIANRRFYQIIEIILHHQHQLPRETGTATSAKVEPAITDRIPNRAV
jgi:hypothetical protein